jgi:hypothetical protein
MSDTATSTVVLEIGAEGGSIRVLKQIAGSGTAEYSVQLRDQSLMLLSGKEGGGEIRRDSVWTENWNDVIKALGRWPWPMLYPMYVAPEYRERVLAEVRMFKSSDGQPARESAVERWTDVCAPV